MRNNYRKINERLVRNLNVRLNRPVDGWTRMSDGHSTANPGHFYIDHSSYGGSSLYCIIDHCGAITVVASRMPNKEMHACLEGIHKGLDLVKS